MLAGADPRHIEFANELGTLAKNEADIGTQQENSSRNIRASSVPNGKLQQADGTCVLCSSQLAAGFS